MKLAALLLVFAIITGYFVSQRFGSESVDSTEFADSSDSIGFSLKKNNPAANHNDEESRDELLQRIAKLEQQVQGLMDSRRQRSPLASIDDLSDESVDEEEEATPPADVVPIFSPRDGRAAARMTRLEEAGFASDQAALIVTREQELQIAELNERWERRRENYLADPQQFDVISSNPLRSELGERDYERYLEANGRSTFVPVGQLFEGSPASIAGLQAGDQIISYDGKRIFNLNELNQVSVQGSKGEPVLIDVVRNGSRMQLAIDRGPLGISVRRGRRGF